MNKKVVFFVILLVPLILLFSFLYFIGITNFFDLSIIKNFSLLDFTSIDRWFRFFYLVIISIFFITTIAIMATLIISVKKDNVTLTSMNIDDLTVKNQPDTNLTNTFDKLVDSLNKNITAIKSYTEIIDTDINKIDESKLESKILETIDTLYQDFSNMVTDLVQSSSISELFEKIIYWGVSFSKSKRGSLMVVDKNKELYIYKTVGWNSEDAAKTNEIRIPLGSGISGKVASENKRIFVTNIENYHDHDFKYKDKYKSNSFISMPIMGVKKVVAVLNLTENKSDMYSINDLEILNVITLLSSKIIELIQIKKKLS